jgi:hypothetical protein
MIHNASFIAPAFANCGQTRRNWNGVYGACAAPRWNFNGVHLSP